MFFRSKTAVITDVKKTIENKSQIEIENNSNNFYSSKQSKTTNVNILLNRVRLDKRKTFKKKVLFFSFLIGLISLLFTFLYM